MESGKTMSIPISELRTDKPIVLPPENTELPLDPEPAFQVVQGWSNGIVQWSGVGNRQLRSFIPGKPEKNFSVSTPVAAPPGIFKNGLLIPCQDGLVYWIDPVTGKELAEPFAAPFVEGQPVELGPAVGIDDVTAAVIAGTTLSKIRLINEPFPHFKEMVRVEVPESLDPATADPALISQRLRLSQMVMLGKSLIVATNKKLFRLRTDDLTVEFQEPMGGHLPKPPALAGGLALFENDRRELVAVGSPKANEPAKILWKLPLSRPTLGSAKIVGNSSFWLAFPDGEIAEYSLADGKPKRNLTAGRALLGGPWMIENHAVVMTPDGGLAALALK
jgi:hypothetical protein